MDGSHWEKLQKIFEQAIALSSNEQPAFLHSTCGGDPALLAELSAMLEEDKRTGSVLDLDLPQAFGGLLGASAEAQLPFELGPYRLLRLLGEGGMGVVWLAERKDAGNLVAIKFLPHAALSPSRRARFAAEIKTLARLKHPFIARLYDAGTLEDGTPWFAMEYVEGCQLMQYCGERKRSVEERLRLFNSICDAVQYAHGQEVIHRDLKPSNILVEPDGTPKLLDFGIAKQIRSLDDSSDQTRPGLRLLTPQYSAPEWLHDGDVGFYTDVYSLGVVLFEMLVGRLPRNNDPRAGSDASIERPSFAVAENPDAPSLLSKSSWKDLDAVCLKATAPDPQRRYRSIEALSRDVDHYLKNEPLEVRPDTLFYKTGKFILRHKTGVAAVSTLTLFIVAMVLFFTVRLTKERNRALEEAARAERVEKFMENMFQGGDKAAGPAKDLQVSTLLQRGVQDARSLDGNPVVQADLYLTLGRVYQQLGRFDDSNSLLLLALERRRSIPGATKERIGESLLALGLLKIDQAKLPEAEVYIRKALSEESSLGPDHPSVIEAKGGLGRLLIEQGHYAKAIDVLNEAVHSSPATKQTPEMVDLLSLLGDAHFYLGHYEIADGIYHDVLQRNKGLHGEQHPSVADTLTNLGHIQSQLGNYAEAERYYQQALAIGKAWYGKDHPETADYMTNLASNYYFMNRQKEADALVKSALDIMVRSYGNAHPRVALVLGQAGMIAGELGHLDETEADYKRAAEIYRSVYGENQFYATEIENLASVYLKRKEYPRAEQMFRKTLQIYTVTQSSTHVHTGLSRIKLGRALLGQRKYREAQTETLAGYQILKQQTNPNISYLDSARHDLVKEYEALHDETSAAKYRAEIAANESSPAKSDK